MNNIKLFALNNLSIEAAIRKVEKEKGVDLGHRPQPTAIIDETYFPQFEAAIREEAAEMSAHYRVFYCLENSIRSLVADLMKERHGSNWWNTHVPELVRNHVEKTRNKERDSGISARSSDALDYTTFGELGEIIKSNWPTFQDVFQNIKALEKVIATLNALRGPIAHCKPLAEDEVIRLHISVRDWFRAMG